MCDTLTKYPHEFPTKTLFGARGVDMEYSSQMFYRSLIERRKFSQLCLEIPDAVDVKFAIALYQGDDINRIDRAPNGGTNALCEVSH